MGAYEIISSHEATKDLFILVELDAKRVSVQLDSAPVHSGSRRHFYMIS